MTVRNGPEGYGWVSRALHWATVVALVAQFTVGYLLDGDDSGRGRGRGRGGDSGEGRGRGRGGDDDGFGDLLDQGWSLLTTHVALGLLVASLAVTRLAWRRVAGLPPWAEVLSQTERAVESRVEKVLLGLLVLMPLSGLLVLGVDDDWLPLHVASHLAFFAVLAAHLAIVLRHTVIRRDGLLRRML